MGESDRQRREGLGLAALVLERFIECTDAQQIIISSYGLREGIVAEMQISTCSTAIPLNCGGAGAVPAPVAR